MACSLSVFGLSTFSFLFFNAVIFVQNKKKHSTTLLAKLIPISQSTSLVCRSICTIFRFFQFGHCGQITCVPLQPSRRWIRRGVESSRVVWCVESCKRIVCSFFPSAPLARLLPLALLLFCIRLFSRVNNIIEVLFSVVRCCSLFQSDGTR